MTHYTADVRLFMTVNVSITRDEYLALDEAGDKSLRVEDDVIARAIDRANEIGWVLDGEVIDLDREGG